MSKFRGPLYPFERLNPAFDEQGTALVISDNAGRGRLGVTPLDELAGGTNLTHWTIVRNGTGNQFRAAVRAVDIGTHT